MESAWLQTAGDAGYRPRLDHCADSANGRRCGLARDLEKGARWHSAAAIVATAAILPVHFLRQQGLEEGRDYHSLRFNTDVGKHGDTGASEVDVLRAVLDGRADAGAVGSPFWSNVQAQNLVPAGAVTPIWMSPASSHCMFTARVDLESELQQRFVDALLSMSFDNPVHRPVLEAEGLKRSIVADTDGYGSLDQACREQALFQRRSPDTTQAQ